MNLEPKMYIGGLPESVVTGDVIVSIKPFWYQ
jgi:hypothetical protein